MEQPSKCFLGFEESLKSAEQWKVLSRINKYEENTPLSVNIEEVPLPSVATASKLFYLFVVISVKVDWCSVLVEIFFFSSFAPSNNNSVALGFHLPTVLAAVMGSFE